MNDNTATLSIKFKFRYTLLLAILIALLVEAGICIYDLILSGGINATGTFINSGPCACYIACSFPGILLLLQLTSNKLIKIASYAAAIFAVIFIPLTLSRTALIALFSTISIICLSNKQLPIAKKRPLIFTIFILGVVILAGITFFFKSASAFGRLFIWKIACRTILRIPLHGVGWEFVGSTYNETQEEYIQDGHASIYEEYIADSISYIFNDFITCLIAYGLLGLVLTILLFGLLFYISVRSRQPYLFATVCSLLITMCGSYPMQCYQFIIFTIIVILFACTYIEKTRNSITISIIYCTLLCTHLTNIPDSNNYGYIFHKAIVLHNQGKYADSNEVLIDYLYPRVTDVRVLYLIGNNYKSIGEYSSAKYYYDKSSYRVPARHYPHYLLMKLYLEQGQIELAKKEAKILLEKKPKVLTKAIEEMRYEAASFIHNHI